VLSGEDIVLSCMCKHYYRLRPCFLLIILSGRGDGAFSRTRIVDPARAADTELSRS
jgi:hypothetical protein